MYSIRTIISGGDGITTARNLSATSCGDTAAEALQGVQEVFDCYSKSHETYVREYPDVASELDFDTKVMHHKGYVRFAFFNRPGKVHPPEERLNYLSLV